MSNLAGSKGGIKKSFIAITLISCVLALAGLILYYVMGKTQYNANQLTMPIVYGLGVAVVCFVCAVFTKIRWFSYGAALAMLYSFLEYIITEINFWTNLILATDPVEANVLTQYVLITGVILVGTIGAFIAAGMAKKSYYKSLVEVKKA